MPNKEPPTKVAALAVCVAVVLVELLVREPAVPLRVLTVMLESDVD